MILEAAVKAAAKAAYVLHSTKPGFDAEAAWDDMAGAEDWERGQWEIEARAALEAAAPHIAAQALRDAVDAFPLETITAPDNAVLWLRRRAEQIGNQA